ncbi:helix-hairpin-helix domain-containing protein [Burkholderia ubonensis]|uniref:helix-hairpin-helix domain-containing protein n=1 Tax=Burkholderia ubonensis TaxID=101571 RepID=UPI00075EB7A0|nr:helix-hairpin-helix domain-containing protein [Burkholderia ubonensis]AOK63856.1 hypothetical protein WM29_32020 [Burkholderia ubonensis]KVK99447.1 hypothetical protein WJ45_00845 [Burkholderia ubonensis]KVN77386.1 hypothetical protein WJ67_14615 [Burkholderia ubonensis]KVO27362.1 hypothetical protein WJ74_28670 [Burkholderia ubonensis]KVQ52312.1 hypothetical protein WK04_05095 [Burkholderia ubonensis]
MNPAKVDRARVVKLTDLPNIGPASAADLVLIGIGHPADLVGRCPFCLYDELCMRTATRHDPCVIDVFISVTQFMAGGPPEPWWAFSDARKRVMSGASPAACDTPAGRPCAVCGRRLA